MAMVAVTTALIGFFAFVIMRVTTPQMTTLFTDLSAEDSSGIIKDLERQAIPFELRNEGAVIMVPKDKVTRLRMKLAESNLPKGGGVGYEIFDKSDALGTTSFVQGINHLRALEGELARTIRAIDRIQAARVHLVLPERPLFSRETPEPSASIVVRVRGALEPQQIRAIRHVVASAVNGLKPQRVSIVDEAGQLLADGASSEADNAVGDDRRNAFEKRLRKQVEDIVSSVVGQGRARVQLSADFDYNKVTQTSDKFDPEGRVLRSSQSREESSATAENNGQATVNNELPGQQRNDGTSAAREQSKKSEETSNYEISRTTKTEVTEAGRVNRVSVAVVVDGNYTKNDKGEVAYQPRPKEEIDRISALVRSAIGFDAKRGDQVEVVNLRFADITPSPINEPAGWMNLIQFTKEDIMRSAEVGVMALLAVPWASYVQDLNGVAGAAEGDASTVLASDCATGAFGAAMVNGKLVSRRLGGAVVASPGDLDEAITAFLDSDKLGGAAMDTAFGRIAAFRRGFFGGWAACADEMSPQSASPSPTAT
jgi:flagellar M-ring protein FliF